MSIGAAPFKCMLEHLQRLEDQDNRLGPWLGQLRALGRSFQRKAAQ